MSKPDPARWGFTTRTVHGDRLGGVEHGGIHKPMHTSVQYGYANAAELIGVFKGEIAGFNYARQGTPTVAALEACVNRMEDGRGTICFATGMAAIVAVFTTLLKAGDHLIASKFVFGNTNSVLGTLQGLGIRVSMVDATDAAEVATAVTPQTRMVFVETIANPRTQVADLAGIGAVCKAHGLIYVVDNTVTSPWLFKPKAVGASLIINSLTKSIGGHGNALGGAVTDTGLFDWSNYPNIFEGYRKGNPATWGLGQIKKKGLRDQGAALSSEASHHLAVGAETLGLRMNATSANAQALAEMLEAHPAVRRVYYPGLASHAQHARAQELFCGNSWLLAFELKDDADCLPFIDRLTLPIIATGLGDTRTLIIPVAHTIFWEMGAEKRAEMGIAESLIRVSVGIEDQQDILGDFKQALGD
ncbi:cystathionine gamma-synthase family protein [Niveibacterium microcysteis]|uniref:Cystathionine gamma-synthase family protein n=1 Tax=Niveibacterium microcysteis TaxID=2811415 RepID=A0ABX7M6W6_9RHOO|nr:cystathionine gamma-synthase family protein [Niveibacterium microcysteis]QSI77261.1 cystathionine gamma-synthase family protein [Niveibacterium microcysteis]